MAFTVGAADINCFERSVAQLYARVFSGAPFFEEWDEERSLQELRYAMAKPNFVSSFGVREGKLNGFAWGYNLPMRNSARANYEMMCNILENMRINPLTAFYLSEVGVDETCRNTGIGTDLVSQINSSIPSRDTVLFRTKNPAMFRVGEKVFGAKLGEFPEESCYAGGRVYIFRRMRE